MNTRETGILLGLFHAKGVGRGLLRRMLDALQRTELNEDLVLSLCADPEQKQIVQASLSQANKHQARQQAAGTEATLRWLESSSHSLIFANDAMYPPLLRQIPDYPPLLFVKGDPQSLRRPMLAMVGSRNSTAYGRSAAYRIAADLADMGLLVCSGLASGIDTQAHVAALDAGSNTVAVLGNGLASVYPAINRALADRITDAGARVGGALVSEQPLHAGPVASHFPQRNRIISGLSMGVCVVEANMRSGSLITARLALEQNREVFAVPGSINSPVSRGCHRLLRQGAVLTESAEDIAEHIRFICQAQMAVAYPDFVPESKSEKVVPETSGSKQAMPPGCQPIYDQICQDAVGIDALLIRTGLALPDLSEKLLQLELSGLVNHQGNRWWRH
ncbi:MAG: DNA-processing protein DprA [Pseudohongiella sp.]|nr:DNA-processing protein DprA [Pseudohongiella sp.]MDO9520977.1 DNA-processing protein DprA [Pseudohongiella sp.]